MRAVRRSSAATATAGRCASPRHPSAAARTTRCCGYFAVDLEHLAPTPVGHIVHGHAEVVQVAGRRIAFKISVRDEVEEIGRGTHARAVIDVARFMERLKAKAAP